MSNSTIMMGKAGNRSVDESSNLLKRLFFVEREAMLTLSGYLVSVSHWDLKKNLPRHIWQDSLRADFLRTRVMEMRYPKRDVDKGHDPGLQALTSALIRCNNDAELIEGVYFVVKQAICEAYETYLEDADPLDDAPTFEFMSVSIIKIKDQLKEIEALYRQLPEVIQGVSKEWQRALKRYLQQNNGILGSGNNISELKADELLLQRPEYILPLVAKRDPRFTQADYHMPPREPKTFIERQVWQAINHINEIWASDAPATLIWKWRDMPWEFYLDAARWCYDESRHCLMGEERLLAWGFEIGKDIPVFSDPYVSVSAQEPVVMLGLIHRLESTSPQWKSGLKRDFEAEGDTASSQDFDYDWADESIHLHYGHRWLLHRLDGDIEALEDLKEEAFEMYMSWIQEAHKKWDYDPFMQRIEAKISEIEVIHHG